MKHTRYCYILRKFHRSGFICVQGLCNYGYPHRLICINIKELELYSDWALRTWYMCWGCRQHILGLFVWPIGVLVKLSGSSSFLSTNTTSVVFVLLWLVRKIWRDSPRRSPGPFLTLTGKLWSGFLYLFFNHKFCFMTVDHKTFSCSNYFQHCLVMIP